MLQRITQQHSKAHVLTHRFAAALLVCLSRHPSCTQGDQLAAATAWDPWQVAASESGAVAAAAPPGAPALLLPEQELVVEPEPEEGEGDMEPEVARWVQCGTWVGGRPGKAVWCMWERSRRSWCSVGINTQGCHLACSTPAGCHELQLTRLCFLCSYSRFARCGFGCHAYLMPLSLPLVPLPCAAQGDGRLPGAGGSGRGV